jgi:hypothetical protein
MTWEAYGQDLEANLQGLHRRLHAGSYRARPSRRSYIPKADGRLRPLGIATVEDKILQRTVVEVLNAVYETDFRGFSYGFRPGRNPHQALDESGTKWGRLRGKRCGIRSLCEAGVPAVEVAGELVVEDPGADLKQQVRTAGCQAHLLFFDHAFADDLVDCGLDERVGDGFPGAVAFSVVGDALGVGA